MYEVEIKVELTSAEKDKLLNSLKENNFISRGVTPQNDFYIEAKKSPYGGNDLKRYRNENGKFIYTEKMWETVNGEKVRKEDEHEVEESEFELKMKEFPNALKIQKSREWFTGSHGGLNISFTIDSVKFDHSPSMRYFIEAEIDTENKEEAAEIKSKLREFLCFVLKKDEIVEAPGMFNLAFNKL